MKRLQIEASKKDVAAVARLLDREGDGYIDFSNFSQAFHATAQNSVKVPNEKPALPFLQPSKSALENQNRQFFAESLNL